MFAGMVGFVGRSVGIDGVRFEGMVSLGCWEVQSLKYRVKYITVCVGLV